MTNQELDEIMRHYAQYKSIMPGSHIIPVLVKEIRRLQSENESLSTVFTEAERNERIATE